ncbi:MAG: hypothetical protein BHW39_02900 [Firmicutes bacterium CAG:552_39_19]|nr:MAG: hypothetical protein BHW39_02900 [Firmicutes bacterium CAG:552_39_19]
MEVTYKKHINVDKENRTEFLFVNWDYEDGVDYIYFSVIKLHLDKITYELLWHEDFGNMIYSIEQEEQVVDMLERRVKVVLSILNEKLKAN